VEILCGLRVAQALERLLAAKDAARYASVYITAGRASAAMQQARRLVDAAEALLH
jgi:hypothetical protein